MGQGFGSLKYAYLGILLLGIVSLMGDVVYEGSRGVLSDYLEFLGASALIAGLVGGLDFLGHALRLISGFLADRTHAYWLFIFLGYGLIVSIPMLGIFTGLEMIVTLVLLERLGKALRSPSRDTILSVISRDVGAGKAFGIHEFLDQVGGVAGPLFVAILMLSSNNDYQYTFSFLFLPFMMLLAALIYTYKRIGSKTIVEIQRTGEKKERLARPFYVYTLAVLLNNAGLISFMLILYKASAILRPTGQQWIVPLIYLLIQGIDAPVALAAGYTYDKLGIKILVIPFILSIVPPLLAVNAVEISTIIVASIFFGLVLGMQESVYRAAVSELTPVSLRGTAYGIFNAAYGFGFLISGAVYGLLMDLKPPFVAVVFYVFIMQITAIASLLNIHRKLRK